jgi:hypothetical protein
VPSLEVALIELAAELKIAAVLLRMAKGLGLEQVAAGSTADPAQVIANPAMPLTDRMPAQAAEVAVAPFLPGDVVLGIEVGLEQVTLQAAVVLVQAASWLHRLGKVVGVISEVGGTVQKVVAAWVQAVKTDVQEVVVMLRVVLLLIAWKNLSGKCFVQLGVLEKMLFLACFVEKLVVPVTVDCCLLVFRTMNLLLEH